MNASSSFVLFTNPACISISSSLPRFPLSLRDDDAVANPVRASVTLVHGALVRASTASSPSSFARTATSAFDRVLVDDRRFLDAESSACVVIVSFETVARRDEASRKRSQNQKVESDSTMIRTPTARSLWFVARVRAQDRRATDVCATWTTSRSRRRARRDVGWSDGFARDDCNYFLVARQTVGVDRLVCK